MTIYPFKKNIVQGFLIALIGIWLFTPVIIAAAEAETNQPEEEAPVNTSFLKDEASALAAYKKARELKERTAYLQRLAELMVENRVTALSAAKTKLATVVSISDKKKAELNKEIEYKSSDLVDYSVTLLAKDIKLISLKTELRDIFSKIYVYRIILPQIYGLVATDKMLVLSTELDGLRVKVKNKSLELSSQGEDATEVEGLIAEATKNLKLVENNLVVAQEEFLLMDFTNSKRNKDHKDKAIRYLLSANDSTKLSLDSLNQAIEKLKALVDEHNKNLTEEQADNQSLDTNQSSDTNQPVSTSQSSNNNSGEEAQP